MRRRFLMLVLCTLPFTMASQRSAEPEVGTTGAGIIAGQIVSDETAPRPIGRAIVSLTGSVAAERNAITTDDGRFQFGGLPTGRFTVSVAKAAYLETAYGATKPGGPGTPIALASGDRVDITLKLAFGAVLAGTITDVVGEPLARVDVSAVRVLPNGETRGSSAWQVKSDDRGMFRIFGVPPGDYLVSASNPWLATSTNIAQPTVAEVDAMMSALAQRARTGPSTAAATGRRVTAPDRPLVRIASVYFPGVPSMQDATRIAVRAAEERGGLDFRFEPVPTATVEGRLSGPLQNLAAAQVALRFRGSGIASSGQTTAQPHADGTFTFSGLVPGNYTITARVDRRAAAPAPSTGPRMVSLTTPAADAASTQDAEFFYATTDIDVRGLPLKDVSLVLQAGSVLSGRLVFDGDPPSAQDRLSPVRVSLAQIGVPTGPFVTTGGFTMLREATALPNGTFSVKSIGPGLHRLGVTVPSALSAKGWWLRSATVDGRDLLDSDLDVAPGTDVNNVLITLSSQHNEISGVLHTAAGQPAPEFVVVVYSADRRAWRAESRRTRMVRPGSDGRFDVRDLPAGEYFIAAVDRVDPDDVQTSAFFEGLVPASLKFQIADGETKMQDLRLAGGHH